MPSPEITYTALTAMFTGVLWVPLILNRIREKSMWPTLRDPAPDQPTASWALRLQKAHRNAIENLTVFAPLALAVPIAGMSTATTAMWCAVFFWARVAHALVYTFGVPVLRTVAFTVGFIAQLVLFLHLVGYA
ncbi:MAPEG family protein [Roseiterribacter gracilis]|uniref:Membrane protein n=1 Tax=Roseiterribacter gracilis TaxID=2812848 RepID=A0A8S8X8C5_9PROT|nr:membrane protein [Rhodospirillales bacterium TMPK1]